MNGKATSPPLQEIERRATMENTQPERPRAACESVDRPAMPRLFCGVGREVGQLIRKSFKPVGIRFALCSVDESGRLTVRTESVIAVFPGDGEHGCSRAA